MAAKQARDVVPVLGQCWASVVDGGLAMAQHWDSVSCLPGKVGIHLNIGLCLKLGRLSIGYMQDILT